MASVHRRDGCAGSRESLAIHNPKSEIRNLQPSADVGESAARQRRLVEIEAAETRNLLALAAHYTVVRIAWVFKTESVIMPMVVDTLSGQAWVRGCLPVLNRFGSSLPPMLLAERLRDTRLKKWGLWSTSTLMGLPFLALSLLWWFVDEKRQSWMVLVFLASYLIFSATNGLNQLSFGTLQGKLIRPDRRGRLLGISGIVGSTLSIACAWFLLRRWLDLGAGGFVYIFAFTGCGFVLAALCVLAVREPADEPDAAAHVSRSHLASAWNVYRHDRDFRRVANVGMLFLCIQLLFPHFQALGRKDLPADVQGFHLMLWVVSQNAAVGLFSMISGSLADRFGNRLAIRLQAFATAAAPLLALWLASDLYPQGHTLFWMAFFLLGLTPVTMRTLVNYTLELADEQQHPRYVSTLNVCLAVPFLFSPLVGLLVTLLGFTAVFAAISGLILAGGLLTFGMAEPREEQDVKSEK